LVFQHLQIPYREERWLVGMADAGLRALTLIGAPFRTAHEAATRPPQRVLLLRLERVGDLVMVLDAIAMARAYAPHAQIDLVVGSWNTALAGLIPGVDSVETLDVPWMTRHGRRLAWPELVRRARSWRRRRYDVAVNFEPDIRSNFLLALSGARRKVGFVSGGGGAFLTEGVDPDPTAHIAANANTLVMRALSGAGAEVRQAHQIDRHKPALELPEAARQRAAELIGSVSPAGLAIGLQPAAGRQIKEWDPVRFAEVGAHLALTRGAKIVLIGSAADRPALDAVRARWPSNVPLVQIPLDTDLVVLAAVLQRLALFITGDTGPMHLAAAVGTPVVAIFGPSLPTRYAPLSPKSRIVRIDIPCSPCNLLRKPPTRCIGHVPDCLAGIEASKVIEAANQLLDA
jgi:ADP-heptose:LPS heptosyltransferase